ncbi:hypothetical protein JG687_00005394 [Phytophthora cactorum]|uniref:Uncharacterized protein n=1 Tax=Phytophthora cactorum TaxID=29920 RepID=A0A8T1UQR9_9STRA|nr:hypothetical protein JG687_00005394 [Phytophthora cactorum]
MTSVEAHRELVVDGDVTQALDMCRRLLRTESSLQRVETAHLVLERLRSGADDSSDGVNALLRLLGNYVAPTRELTEEILSLLLFCDHRVLLIHHLPKLTYQSKECVQLVVQAYLELLATDRSLLVPVLGSLAEMPLDNSEKNTIVEATQSLLDAAVEEDIPAVVQSLLSMATKSSAPKALARLRTECNRIQSGTLSLTMEVIGRFATSGSVALTALLRLIRHAEPLTMFDIVLLTFVMGKSAENELAVRTATSVAQSGRLHELSRAISNEEYDQPGSVMDDDFEVDSTEAAAVNTATRNLMAHSLACIYESFIVILEECRIATAAGDSSWTDQMMKLLGVGASPDDDVSCCVNPHGFNEIFFRFLARQCLELTDPTLACLVTDALIALVLNTRKHHLVSQLCLALLHQTFPSLPTPNQFEKDTGKFFSGLPLRSLSNAVVSPSNGRMCSLAKYRCTALKWRHVAYLVVGSWAYSTSASAGSFLLAQYLEEMRVLIDAAVPHQDKRSRKKRTARIEERDDESDGDDLEEKHRQDELAVVVNGEHIVLKSLTNESLPYFIEAVLLCAIASLYRAVPRKPSSQGLSDLNPLSDYCRAMHVFESVLRVFAQAEMCGFNLPVKTNLLVLRGGTFATRTAKSIITKCIAWRVEQSVTDNTGALGHLSVLFGAADAMATTMETVTSAFQERVMLKMQYNGNSRQKGGWTNELLAKAYGKKYNTRRWISKSEAKLLPFFSHGIQELQDFLQDQSSVNNIALEAAKADWKSADSVWSDYEHRDVMLSDDKLVSACRTLQAKELTATLFKDWRPALSIDNDDDETDLEDDEELDELDEESLSEEEDDGADSFVVKSYATATSNRKPVPGLTGRKQLAVELQDNEDLGFPTIVVNFKKQKKTHKSS